mmetsp:Transcript_10624/g.26065  ORF Transcript_10624/g.26065 Transcript_10624/m.26065 type:complete len:252 (+) Transcript_10624:462-1217(+)
MCSRPAQACALVVLHGRPTARSVGVRGGPPHAQAARPFLPQGGLAHNLLRLLGLRRQHRHGAWSLFLSAGGADHDARGARVGAALPRQHAGAQPGGAQKGHFHRAERPFLQLPASVARPAGAHLLAPRAQCIVAVQNQGAGCYNDLQEVGEAFDQGLRHQTNERLQPALQPLSAQPATDEQQEPDRGRHDLLGPPLLSDGGGEGARVGPCRRYAGRERESPEQVRACAVVVQGHGRRGDGGSVLQLLRALI